MEQRKTGLYDSGWRAPKRSPQEARSNCQPSVRTHLQDVVVPPKGNRSSAEVIWEWRLKAQPLGQSSGVGIWWDLAAYGSLSLNGRAGWGV
jgi:hypothetical protein